MSLLSPHACQSRWSGRFVAVLFLLGGWLQPLAAHVVKQLYGEFRESGETWELEILFDAGYADPASRNDPEAAQPTRDWLVALSGPEQARLTEETRRYLEEMLSLHAGGTKIDWQAGFPDFDSNPPAFPSLLNDGAYFHVSIRPLGDTPNGLSIAMAAGDHPDLVLKLPGTGEATYLTVTPGGEVVLKEAIGEKPAVGRSPVVVAFEQGVLHVVPRGLDHILFVLGIFLLKRRWKPLLTQSLAFTAAHTITLGLAAAGRVTVPAAVVEPLIALSIAALAVENLFVREAKPWRLGLVFAFGLVHGLGFAGALATWIRPGEGFLPTLVAANLGVEIGQAIVLAAAWLLTMRWHDSRAWPHFRRWACVALALAGLWWFVERVGWFSAFAAA
jgi:hypothetical protein